jgi:hypothetical protein
MASQRKQRFCGFLAFSEQWQVYFSNAGGILILVVERRESGGAAKVES